MSIRSRVVVLTTILVLGLANSEAQTWSYHGSSMCYNSGAGSAQCYSSGTIQRYATSQEQFDAQFKAGFAAGEGVGNLVNALASKWAEHRRVVEAERNDLRAQLRAFGNANDELMGDLVNELNDLIDLTPRLARYVPAVARDSGAVIAFYGKTASDLMKQKPVAQKNLATIIEAKDRKFLRQCLDVEQKRYRTLYEWAERGYVFTEFVKAVLGYYEYQQQQGNSSLTATLAMAALRDATADLSELASRADGGDAKSQLELGKLFLEGRGVPQDYVYAHMWLNMSAAAGIEEARGLRDALAARMTADQLAEAQKLAREWKVKVAPSPSR